MASPSPSIPTEEMALVAKLHVVSRQRMADGRRAFRPHWNVTSRLVLEHRLGLKYQQAKDSGMTWELAADIANYAAMLADNREVKT